MTLLLHKKPLDKTISLSLHSWWVYFVFLKQISLHRTLHSKRAGVGVFSDVGVISVEYGIYIVYDRVSVV